MINGETQIYGVIGRPVRHSLSPVIHNGVFQRMGLNAAYLAFETGNLYEAVRGIRGLDIRGVSVTLPFKTEIVYLLDEVRGLADKIRAVNTVANRDGRLIGYNTDWSGALEALEERVDLQGKRVLLLGAGGAARAIAYGLKARNCEVMICNRSEQKARDLARELGLRHQPVPSLKDLEPQVVINATRVGMHPNDGESPFPKELLRARMTIMDIVYYPLKTRLLRDGEERGCQTIDGLEMLARQAAGQTEIWTGERPDISEIKKDLQRALR